MIPRVQVVVIGGGTAGWMTAVALSSMIPGAADVHLVEAEEIPIVGVGEATLPHLRAFLERIGIDERTMMRATEATFKLGIRFEDFGAPGERYVHPFGTYGRPLNGVDFHHYWLRAHHAKSRARLDDHSVGVLAAETGRFGRRASRGEVPAYGYAYQFDATRLAPHLREIAAARGVRRSEGRIVDVERDGASGDVVRVRLADGAWVAGDLFVDCSGFRSLLLGGTMGEQWEDWSHWLPCDRAVVAPSPSPPGPIEPFTRAVAMPAGWRWRIPLRHRVGNGYVYSSAHLDDDEAAAQLTSALEGAPVEPRLLRFRAGRYRRSWVNNVVAVGLASGFLEPLESTSIYLAQMAITELVERFPIGGVEPLDRNGFNAAVDHEYDRIRDFLILHYHATRRRDCSFWNDMRTMRIPDTLLERLELWRRAAIIPSHQRGLFLQPSWVLVLIGQGIVPTCWDPRADLTPLAQLERAMSAFRTHVAAQVAALPTHRDALEDHDA